MTKIRRYIVPFGIIVVVVVSSTVIDIITSKGITSKRIDDFRTADAYFNLAPGFVSKFKTVKISEAKRETNFACTTKSEGEIKTIDEGIYLNRQERYQLTLEKDFNKPIQITVNSISEDSDPAIIIESSDGKISRCQDYEHEEIETLYSDEVKMWSKFFPKGTYYMWIGDYYRIAENYTITISEEN